MTLYAIIETNEGLTVAEMGHETQLDEEAVRQGGVVVDPGPYHSYEEAYDAMLAIDDEDEEDDAE